MAKDYLKLNVKKRLANFPLGKIRIESQLSYISISIRSEATLYILMSVPLSVCPSGLGVNVIFSVPN